MFKSQQYRARATACGELVKGSTSAEESRDFKTWRAGFDLLTDDKRGFAEDCDEPVHIAEQDRSCGAALTADEEHVLRCLGAALIMQWNALPTMLQTGDVRRRRVGRKASGDSSAPRADCAISAQAQG